MKKEPGESEKQKMSSADLLKLALGFLDASSVLFLITIYFLQVGIFLKEAPDDFSTGILGIAIFSVWLAVMGFLCALFALNCLLESVKLRKSRMNEQNKRRKFWLK